jgi:diguanylate cyclase (GGDEF)-like protein
MGASVRRSLWCFALLTGAVTAVHPFLPAGTRALTYLLISAATMVPLVSIVRRLHGRDRLPWALLFVAMAVLTTSNALIAVGGPGQRMPAELLVTVGHTVLLAAAVVLVLRRAGNDIGGLIDVSVCAIGLGGLLWTALLFPRLTAMGATAGAELALLVSILVLAGVLGALVRIWYVAERLLPAVTLFVAALLAALIGNTVLAVTTGSMTVGRPGWIESLFMIAYVCVGAVPYTESVDELRRPGPAPSERLSTGRLVFLGAAVAVTPVAGGLRAMAGLPADGPLLALGILLVAPLVMTRVGRLAREREQAEAALRHQATHDALTGLPNRAELRARLDAALARERAAGRRSVVLLFCDLNGFKAVNDRLGHAAGDRLLIEVGERIKAGLRAGDTLARYGGDEFLVLCEDDEPDRAEARLTAHVHRALAAPFHLAGEAVPVGTSVGAVRSDRTLGADELIGRADQAMYQAKQLVRGRA